MCVCVYVCWGGCNCDIVVQNFNQEHKPGDRTLHQVLTMYINQAIISYILLANINNYCVFSHVTYLGLGGLSLAMDVLSLAFSNSFSSRSSRHELSSTSFSLRDSLDSCNSSSLPSSERRERFKSAWVTKNSKKSVYGVHFYINSYCQAKIFLRDN